MSIPGRRPLPSALQVVGGTASKRPPKERNEAKIPPARPMPPEHLSDDAKVEWGRLIDDLFTCGLMTKVDRAALAAYCDAYGQWVAASQQLADDAKAFPGSRGLTIRTTNGNVIQNPVLGTLRVARADMVRFAVEFGMTPSARSRIDVGWNPGAGAAAEGAAKAGAGEQTGTEPPGRPYF